MFLNKYMLCLLLTLHIYCSNHAIGIRKGKMGSNQTTRITGGKITNIEKYPYQVMVICKAFVTISVCGGALINRRTILTAAHCVHNCKLSNLAVIAGATERDKEHEHRVSDVTEHPDYKDSKLSNDIAVVCLKYNLRYSDRIQPISVTDTSYPDGTSCVITGWGKINNNEITMKLRWANVKLASRGYCKKINPFMDETQLCTDGDGVGPCKGDSGGPLVTDDNLIGLVSYGDVDCTAKMVRMYTNVYHFRNFIEDNTC